MQAQPLMDFHRSTGEGTTQTTRDVPLFSRAMMAGRFIELNGYADLSVAARLVREAQAAGAPAVWVGPASTAFFPPDWAEAGIDLEGLAVVQIEPGKALWRACDTLLRSGGFGVVVADAQQGLQLPFAVQTRLTGLTQRHHNTLVLLKRPHPRESFQGSLVSLRAETAKRRVGHDCFVCDVHVVKDKRRAPGWLHEEYCRGTDGLC